VSLPCCARGIVGGRDSRDRAVVGKIVDLHDRSARIGVGGRHHHVVPAQTHRDVSRRRIEHRYFAIIAAHPSFSERLSEIRDPVVRGRDKVNRVGTSGSRVLEGVVSSRIRSNGVEWPRAVRSNAVQDDPRTTHRLHARATGAYDPAGHLLRNRWKSGLQEQQDRQTTY